MPKRLGTKRLGPKRLDAKTSRSQNGLVPKRPVTQLSSHFQKNEIVRNVMDRDDPETREAT